MTMYTMEHCSNSFTLKNIFVSRIKIIIPTHKWIKHLVHIYPLNALYIKPDGSTTKITSTTQVVEEVQLRHAAHTLCLEQLYIFTPVHLYTFIIQVYTCSMNPGATLASVEVS